MVPSSVANRKCVALPLIMKSAVPLKTTPVGFPPGVLSHCGTETTRLCAFPFASYRVESPVPLSDTHQNEVELAATPHGFTRFVSLTFPTLGMSEVRMVTL